MSKAPSRKRIQNVAVVLRLAGASGRDLLSGISRYARENCHWRMTVVNGPDLTSETMFQELASDRFDGVISSEAETDEDVFRLASLGKPVAIIGWHGNINRPLPPTTAFVRNDDEDVGHLGARYLRSLGRIRSFGFVRSDPRTYWSLLREKGFRAELSRSGAKADLLKTSAAHSSHDNADLVAWLKSLPKPAAVMAAYDELAVRVLDACREAAIEVPRKLAVLGVDNDALLCDFSTPPLSSIYPNHLREGEMAAEELERLLSASRKSNRTSRHAICREKSIVERESTATLTPAAHLVEEALRFISQNANRPIDVSDVVRHLHVSRRLADLRFREFGGGSIAEAIRKARLKLVATRLRETDLPIGSIASACGFDNLQHLANAFRREYGMTMSAYRSGTAEGVRRALPRR